MFLSMMNAMVAVVWLFASQLALPVSPPSSAGPARGTLCLTLNSEERRYLLSQAILYGSATPDGESYRSGTGMNFTVPPESVSFAPPDSLLCETAAIRYRAARQLKYPGASNGLFAIALVRIGSFAYLGDSQFGDPSWGKELVLFDSQLNVRSITRGRF